MYILAHLSDPHLPLPSPSWEELLGKRMTGFLSWKWRRHKIHRADIRAALMKDLAQQKPDHIVITGDLINISLPKEVSAAANFLKELGTPDNVSLVPGNHDAYVRNGPSLEPWLPYMEGGQFPYVRYRGDIALIGLSSAVPTPPFFATGELGESQLRALRRLLTDLKRKNLCRIILIHHPPYGEDRFPRKALRDAPEFRKVIAECGAELILHGHMHLTSMEELEGPGDSKCPVFGVASASAIPYGHKDAAGYHLYTIERKPDRWEIVADIRQWRKETDYPRFPSTGRLRYILPT